MKRLPILLLYSFFVLQSRAQNDNNSSLPNKKRDYYQLGLAEKIKSWKAAKDTNITNNLGFLSGKPGIYRLPQDNMPCIVPDSAKTVCIPNAWKGPKRIPYRSNPPRMPNITKPWVPTPINHNNQNTNADSK